MRLTSELRMYARFLRGLPTFLRNPVQVDAARASITRRLGGREEALVRFADRGLFSAPRSPYPALFRLAGCEPGDLRALVHDRGVEGALLALREAGVYFTFEEFKGRVPVVRNGRELPLETSDFDNPFLTRFYEGRTSGSTGTATRVNTDLEHLGVEAEHRLVALSAHGLLGAPWAIWRPPLPAGSGINNVLRGARAGQPPSRWFTPLVPNELRPGIKYRLATRTIVALGRALGANLPWPERVPLDEGIRIARWMAAARDAHGRVWLNAPVSGGLRVAIAAREAGLDLRGATFMLAGEPATPAKVRGIHASGATHFTDYGMAEAGRIAVGCVNAREASDVHLLSDAYAVIPWPRTAPHSTERVTSFHISALHPSSPKLLLNVEFDDYGILDERPCGCPLEALGLRVHLRAIRSYGKLTGEGVTLVGSEMVHILEEVLPARFGGSPLDYQMAEEEDERGFTRLTLVVSPRIDLRDHDELRDVVLSSLSRSSAAADMARAFWQQAGTFRVRRAEPRTSARGKQSPLFSGRLRVKDEES
jgi:hypothetical protein